MATKSIEFIELKTIPEPFEAVWKGLKKYEIRSTTDRVFSVGAVLKLREWDPSTQTYSGRIVVAEVLYMTPGGRWGLPEDLCVLSIDVLRKGTEKSLAAKVRHYGPWRQYPGGSWFRREIEDCCVEVATGTQDQGYYPYAYAYPRACRCEPPPADWWCCGTAPCGHPLWHESLEDVKARIDRDLLKMGDVLFDTEDEARAFEIDFKKLERLH